MNSRQTLRALLLAAAAVLTNTVASAMPIDTLFNTGVDAAGATLANNAADSHYKLTAVPSGTTDVRVATSANGFPIPPWIGDNALSAWIGPNSGISLDGPGGNYTYETTFDLSGLLASTASIAGRWSVDNTGIDIVLNGVSTGSAAAGFGGFDAFNIASGFIDGLNTLDFIVYNESGPTGLRVEMTGAADGTPVPEPISLAILGSGLFAAGLFRRKRA